MPVRPAAPQPEAVSIKTAAVLLGGVSRGHVYRLVKSGKLKTVALGRRRVVPMWAIRELLAGATAAVEPTVPLAHAPNVRRPRPAGPDLPPAA